MSTSNYGPQTHQDLVNDAQLLDRFVTAADHAAFAVLVQRHGPLVLGVCRRALHHEHDAEDAFQAAFVVLARKASSISKHDSVASWLYKVAHRIAMRQRQSSARRRNQEQKAPPRLADSGLGDVVRRELQQVLDEEVRRLPEKYRAPILLCYLQGQTNEEAATALDCPTGTVKIRLLRGRELLRKRLVKRGLALSVAGLVGEMLVEMGQAAVPHALAHAASQATLGGASAAAGLADVLLRSMCLAKLKVAAVVLLTLGLIGLADGMVNRAWGSHSTNCENQTTPPPKMAPTALDGLHITTTPPSFQRFAWEREGKRPPLRG